MAFYFMNSSVPLVFVHSLNFSPVIFIRLPFDCQFGVGMDASRLVIIMARDLFHSCEFDSS